ncbi:MAG TPA: tetratricopeptide repeat protein [Pedobacter sp.]
MINKVVKTGLMVALVGGSSAFAQSLTDVKRAIDAEQYQTANTSLKKIIATQPSAEAYFHLGNLYLTSNYPYPDSAKAAFDKGAAADAKSPFGAIGLGTLDLRNNNAAGAKANFDKAISLAGKKDNDPYIYAAKALIAAKKPDLTTAVTYLQKAIAIDPKDAEAYLALGDAYREQQKYSEAFSAYRSAYDYNKNLLRAKIELGVINKRSQAWQESINEFNSVLAINPNYGPAHRELAETYNRWARTATETKDYESRNKQALDAYVKYMDKTDRSLESRMRYADFLILAKDYKTLEREAQEMARLDKTNPRIYRYLAYSAFENGNYPASIEAINTFMSKVQKDRIIPQDYVYLAKAQLKTGDVSKGLSNLKTAASLDASTSVEGLNVIAKELYDAKKFDLAAQIYDLTQAAENAALIDYYWQGNSYYWDYVTKFNAKANPSKDLLVKADSAYSKLLQRSPTTEAGWLSRAKVAKLMDDDNQSQALAVGPYEKYVELVTVTKPEKAEKAKAGLVEAYYYLGAAASAKNNQSKAREYFNKVLQLDPSNTNAQTALKSLASK